MSLNAPRVLLQTIFLIYCLLTPLAEKVCVPPLINLFSVSTGLLDLHGSKSFSLAGPKEWNKLPKLIREPCFFFAFLVF